MASCPPATKRLPELTLICLETKKAKYEFMLIWNKYEKYCFCCPEWLSCSLYQCAKTTFKITRSWKKLLCNLTFSLIQFQILGQNCTRLRTIRLTYGCGQFHRYTVRTYRAARKVSLFSLYSWHKIPSMHYTILSVLYHSLEHNILLPQRQPKCKHSRRLVYFIYCSWYTAQYRNTATNWTCVFDIFRWSNLSSRSL